MIKSDYYTFNNKQLSYRLGEDLENKNYILSYMHVNDKLYVIINSETIVLMKYNWNIEELKEI